jgi:hypothetical protein
MQEAREKQNASRERNFHVGDTVVVQFRRKKHGKKPQIAAVVRATTPKDGYLVAFVTMPPSNVVPPSHSTRCVAWRFFFFFFVGFVFVVVVCCCC